MRAKATIVVDGAGVEVEQLWHDPSRWASWLDGFGNLVRLDDHWPLDGARRMWNSPPGGRGLVSETVSRYDAGRGHTLHVEDTRVSGVQRVSFESDGLRTRITVEFEFEPKERTPPARKWWMARKLRESQERSLRRFSYELAAERQ